MEPLTLLGAPAWGWAAAALTLLTFLSQDMRRLRALALAANAAFIAYGVAAQLWPVLVLHLVLVPVNLWRLGQALRGPGAEAKGHGPGAAASRPAAGLAAARRARWPHARRAARCRGRATPRAQRQPSLDQA